MASEARFIARQFGRRLVYSGLKRSAQAAGIAAGGAMAYGAYKRYKRSSGRRIKRGGGFKRRFGSGGRRRFMSKRSYRVTGTREERRVTIRAGARNNRASVSKALNASVQPYILFYKGLDSQFRRNGPGYYECGRTGPNASSHYTWPVYAFNLTTIVQSNVTAPVPFRRLRSDNSNRFWWEQQVGITNDGSTTSTQLQIRNQVNVSSNGLNQPRSLLDWVRMRFILYGPSARPGKFMLQIVKFHDDEIAPEIQSGATTDITANNDLNTWAVQYVRKLTANPIAHQGIRGAQKRMSVVASKVFDIEAPLTDDTDSAGIQRRVVDWFYNVKKILNFYDTRAITNGAPEGGTLSFAETGTASLITTPANIKDRLYLLISAEAHERFGTLANDDVHDPSVHCSFDMNIELGYKTVDNA